MPIRYQTWNLLPTTSRRAVLPVRSWLIGILFGIAILFVGTRQANACSESTVQDAVSQIQRYCTTCWRNARVPKMDWNDCSQQVFAELLRTVPSKNLGAVWMSPRSSERRELDRAIWRVAKRTIRAYRRSLPHVSNARSVSLSVKERDAEAIKDVIDVAEKTLPDRQFLILRMTCDGYSVRDIARLIGLSPARVSDEKYRATARLRSYFDSLTSWTP